MKKLSSLAGAILLALLGLTSPGKSQQVVRQGTTPWVVGGTVNIGGTLPAFASTPSFICASGCTPSAPFPDGSNFVAGTTAFNLNGGFFQTTATGNPLTNLQSGAFQLTANRAVHINLRNAAAAEVGVAAAPLRVDPTGATTQPVSGAVSLTGTLPAFAVTPTFNCGTGCGGSGGAIGAADESAFVAGTTQQVPVGGFYQSTVTANALTNGQSGASQLTINRALHINLRNASGVELGVTAAPVRTDPTGTTIQPVSATTLPLPSGASTAAKQAQFTAAGTPSTTDVYTVQGCPTCAAQSTTITGTLPAYASTPAFTISGLLPAFASPPSVTITGSLPGFATTPAVSISGTPAVTISGSLPGYASTPTFNLGSLNGAATAAKQPALGSAGSPSIDVISVQGIASGTPQNVTATSLPLPAGASTAAKQPALGTAGSPAADVISVQGTASMTPLSVTATNGVSSGTAGSPAADVVTIQGTAGMTPIAVSGVTSGGGASEATIGGALPAKATTIGLDNGTGLVLVPKALVSGVAGAPSTDVITVQGNPGMSPVAVTGASASVSGSYCMSMASGLMAAGLAANAPVYSFHYAAAGTGLAIVRSITFSAQDNTTGFAAGTGTFNLIAARAFTAADTGGTAATLTGNNGKLRTSFATTAVDSIRISSTATLTAGTRTLDAQPLKTLTQAVPTTIGYQLFGPDQVLFRADNTQQQPLQLVPNEGFVITTTVPATGTWNLNVTTCWDETAAF